MQNGADVRGTRKIAERRGRAGCPNTGAPAFSIKRSRSEILLACETPVRCAEQESHWTTAPLVGGRLPVRQVSRLMFVTPGPVGFHPFRL